MNRNAVPDQIHAQVVALAKRCGSVAATARTLQLAEATTARLLGKLPVHRGTLALAELRLAALSHGNV